METKYDQISLKKTLNCTFEQDFEIIVAQIKLKLRPKLKSIQCNITDLKT